MASILYTENLYREFKSGKETIQALKNINISIPEKKLTILRGRSGSGKTTLINMLGVLDKPTKGKVYFNDAEASNLSEINQDKLRRTSMGFVFQSFALISFMSSFENVEYPLRLIGMKAKERKAVVEESLGMVGLGKRMKHMPSELSGGEQQRVAIARAMAHNPKVIFADEPTAELDTHMALQIMKIFRELVDKKGVTVVMTTHDPNMMELADVTYSLEDGEVVDTYSVLGGLS
jgi:putative ABC transport system ATP-binding protein